MRDECEPPVAGLPAGHRRRPLRDRRDGQGRRAVLLLQADPPDPRHGPPVGPDARHRGPPDQHRAGRLRGRARWTTSPTRSRATAAPIRLTDPNPPTAGDVIDIFAGAAHAPAVSRPGSRRRDRGDRAHRRAGRRGRSRWPTPSSTASSPTSASRASVLTYVSWPTKFDSRRTEAALEDTDIRIPPLSSYADKLWDYWERHLDPDLFRDRTLIGRGPRAGWASAAGSPRSPSSRSRTSCCASGAACAARPRWSRPCAAAS